MTSTCAAEVILIGHGLDPTESSPASIPSSQRSSLKEAYSKHISVHRVCIIFLLRFSPSFLEYSGARVPKINDIYTSTVQVVGINWAASNQLLHLWVGFENFAAGVFLNLQLKIIRTCYCPFVHCE